MLSTTIHEYFLLISSKSYLDIDWSEVKEEFNQFYCSFWIKLFKKISLKN